MAGFLQGLKPVFCGAVTRELKLPPPKEEEEEQGDDGEEQSGEK